MARRSKSSERWLREHFSDPFVKRAQAEGWRSRAVFKLEQIDQRERLLKPGMVVLDLGAAPGAWSQYVRRRVGTPGGWWRAICCRWSRCRRGVPAGRLSRGRRCFSSSRPRSGPPRVDLLLSDMAPNMSGMDAIDAPRVMYLAELALDLAGRS